MTITLNVTANPITVLTTPATTAYTGAQVRDLGQMLGRDRVAKTAAYTVVAGDRGKTIDCTSGTFTVSLTAAATLANGFHVAIANSGSGTITIDGNAAETIRGPAGSAATLALAQGQGVVLVCDGTGWLVVSDVGLKPSGAASSGTDNAIVRMDGTTGGTQNSGVTIDDSNNVTGVAALTVGAGLTVSAGTTAVQALTATTGTFTGNITVDKVGANIQNRLIADDNRQSELSFTNRSASGLSIYRPASSTDLRMFGTVSSADVLTVTNAAIGSGVVSIAYSTASTSATTGALTVAGGLGVNGSVFISTGLTIAATSGTTLTVSSTSATAISCAGGASFANGLTVSAGATSVQALTSTTLSLSTTNTGIILATAATTNAKTINIANNGADAYFGIEGSTPGGYFAGSAAYDTCVYTGGNIYLRSGSTGTIKLGIAGSFVTVPGTSATALSCAGGIRSTSATTGIGYGAGAGGTVTQLTSRSTGVTINKVCGQITTNNTSLASGAEVSFVVTNSTIVATDVIILSIASGTTSADTKVSVAAVGAGSFTILIANLSGGAAETGAFIINFAAIKAVSA